MSENSNSNNVSLSEGEAVIISDEEKELRTSLKISPLYSAMFIIIGFVFITHVSDSAPLEMVIYFNLVFLALNLAPVFTATCTYRHNHRYSFEGRYITAMLAWAFILLFGWGFILLIEFVITAIEHQDSATHYNMLENREDLVYCLVFHFFWIFYSIVYYSICSNRKNSRN